LIALLSLLLFLAGARASGEGELITKYTFDPGGCEDYTATVIREAAGPEYFDSVWKKTGGGRAVPYACNWVIQSGGTWLETV